MKELHPNALVLIHPEARFDVANMADYAGSTKGIIDYVNKSDKTEFIIGTEQGIIHELEKKNPDKKFYLLNKCLLCKFMKLISLEDVYNCLKNEEFEITVDENIRIDAKKALDKMLELS